MSEFNFYDLQNFREIIETSLSIVSTSTGTTKSLMIEDLKRVIITINENFKCCKIIADNSPIYEGYGIELTIYHDIADEGQRFETYWNLLGEIEEYAGKFIINTAYS